jgi:CDP-glycerol glycerophosphotransferase (TagB/SpsB family)
VKRVTPVAGESPRCLLYVERDYSFDILRPLQAEARRRGWDVRWFVMPSASSRLLQPRELRVPTVPEAITWSPHALFAPGNAVPGFIPGLKVQVFHGLNEDKRGTTYSERGMFDLYCTHGPSRTEVLAPLAEQRGYFRVKETGWLKLDSVLKAPPHATTYDRPQILFASTFTPRLSGAEALLPTIRALSGADTWQWLVTLHPQMARETTAVWKALESENLSYFTADRAIELMHRADVMVSDNSSILQEFLLLEKPVVTYRNRDPGPFLVDIREPDQLESAIRSVLQPPPALLTAIRGYGPSVTPWLDGASSGRIMDATEEMMASGWSDTKPRNIQRNWKIRRQLGYYRLG